MDVTSREKLVRSFAPTVLVASTPDADAICAKNSLTCVDLLRPFADAPGARITAVHGEDREVELRDFFVRFTTLADLVPSSMLPENGNALRDIVNAAQLQLDFPVIRSLEDVSLFFRFARNQNQELSPWFDAYRLEFMNQLRLSEHETFGHPVACMCFVSTSHPDPMAAVNQLYNTQNPPGLFQEGFMDPQLLKYAVLLHDETGGVTSEAADATFNKLKTVFGLGNCRLLKLNGLAAPDLRQADIWSQHMPVGAPTPMAAPPVISAAAAAPAALGDDTAAADSPVAAAAAVPPGRGQYLTTQNVVDCRGVVVEFVVQKLVPFMVNRIRTLRPQVEDPRKGIGRWTKMFRGKKNDKDILSEVEGKGFNYTTPEMQLRLLADTSFMLQDYSSALATYKLLLGEVKQDKAPKFTSGVLEMCGIAAFHAETASREIGTNLDAAIQGYQKSNNIRYWRRAVFALYDVLCARRQFAEALFCISSVVASVAPGVPDLACALCSEQAALCYLRMSPPAFRKYAYQMANAGERFQACWQQRHAIRALRAALGVYEERDWRHIEDGVQHDVARLLAQLQQVPAAIRALDRLMGESRQSPVSQQQYLDTYLAVVKQHKRDVQELPLPIVKHSTVRVRYGDYQPPDPSEGLSKVQWAEMERSAATATEGDRQQASQFSAVGQHVIVVGERLWVEVELSNPLKVPIILSNLLLHCVTTADGAAPQQDAGTAAAANQQHIQLDPLQVTLGPGESTLVRLPVLPRAVCTISIKGLEYVMNGQVRGVRLFQVRGPRLNKTKEHRINVMYAPDHRLELRVTQTMPLLRAEVLDFPKQLLNGAVVKTTLQLTNIGQCPLKRLRIKNSHPGYFSFGAPVVGGAEVESQDPLASGASESLFTISNDLFDASLHHVPVAELGAGEMISLPLWVRASSGQKNPGSNPNQDFHLLFCYEPMTANPLMPYRLSRVHLAAKVLTSLRVRSTVLASPLSTSEYVIGLDVDNLQSNEFHVTQVTAISKAWRVQPLSFDPKMLAKLTVPDVRESAVAPLFAVATRESTSLYFLLSRHPVQQPANAAAPGAVVGGPVALATSSVLLSQASWERRALPTFDLLLRDKIAGRPAKKRKATLQNFNLELDDPDYVEEASLLYYDNSVDLVLWWRTANGQNEGQAHVLDVTLGPSHDRNRPDPTPVQPLKFHLEFPPAIEHDFANGPCIVPVTFHCRNIHPRDKLALVVQPLGPDEPDTVDAKVVSAEPAPAPAAPSGPAAPGAAAAGAPATGSPSAPEAPAPAAAAAAPAADRATTPSRFVWVGPSRITVSDLAPDAARALPMAVAFSQPGTFNLNRYRVLQQPSKAGGPTEVHVAPFPHLISVTQKAA